MITSTSKKGKSKSSKEDKLAGETSDHAVVDQAAPSPVVDVDGSRKDRQRGPVEEVIARRMRQLGKKLQRYRSYSSQAPPSLNADQRAALHSLPGLEGAYRELEELTREKGPVDEQELIQAAKLREATVAAQAVAEAAAATRVEQYKTSFVSPLSLFLRLHTLLHPARPADHEHLTFGHLTLPMHLQDEVQATDVLRVGRMWEELSAGEQTATQVLDSLVQGPTGEDEENDHIHHLLDLLAQPEPAPQTSSEYFTENPSELGLSERDRTDVLDAESSHTPSFNATEYPTKIMQASSEFDSRAESEKGLPNGHAPAAVTNTTGGVLNFLQDDELEAPTDDLRDRDTEDGYEVVPMMETHQTSGLQPPFEESYPTTRTPDSGLVTQTQAAPAFAPVTTRNWADFDDEDDWPAAATTQPALVEQTIEPSGLGARPAVALVQEKEMAPPLVSDPVTETATSVESTAPAPSAIIASSAQPTTSGPSISKAQPQQQRRGPGPRQPKLKEPVRKTIVDEDGFEMKVRRAAIPVRGGRGGGRGGSGGDARGARGGGRRGRGGRGGSNRSPSAPNAPSGPNQSSDKTGQHKMAESGQRPNIVVSGASK